MIYIFLFYRILSSNTLTPKRLAWLPAPEHPLTSKANESLVATAAASSSSSEEDDECNKPAFKMTKLAPSFLRQYPLLKPPAGPHIPRQMISLTFRKSRGLDRRSLTVYISYYDELLVLTQLVVERVLRAASKYVAPLTLAEADVSRDLRSAFLAFFRDPTR